MKKYYERPEWKIVEVSCEDIVRTSLGNETEPDPLNNEFSSKNAF